MAKFGKEIHTGGYHPEDPLETKRLVDQDAPTGDIGIENDVTSAGLQIPKRSTADVKQDRFEMQKRKVREYLSNYPASTPHEPTAHSPEWQLASPELAAGMERVNALQADFNKAFDDLAATDILEKKEDLVDRELHKVGMAELARKQAESLQNNSVNYQTEKSSIDAARPDLWSGKQKAKFAQIVYTLNKQGLEYKLSQDMPMEQQVLYKGIIDAVKEGRYNPDTNSIMGKARNAIVLLAAALAAQRMRAARAFGRRR